MTKIDIVNRCAVAVYLAAAPVLTGLVDQHELNQGAAVIIAAGITAIGSAFHLGQAVVVAAAPKPPEAPAV